MSSSCEAPTEALAGCKPEKKERLFDFAQYPQRHIVLKLAYHGHNFDGLAKQDHTTNTVETIVCDGLKRLRLIPETGPQKFSRCGRTDKGVSALGNAFSLMIRASADDEKPLDYCTMINNVLPATIRIVGWSFVADEFDARFSCKHRVYRYFFANRSLDLEKMRVAASYLVGTHNFRNFCMLDVVNVDNFTREVMDVKIVPSSLAPELLSYCEIKGNAFLYHQIRCTMTVLFAVGHGYEAPEVVRTLLSQGDAKPIYPLADDSPLVLWDCNFGTSVPRWHMSERALEYMLLELQDISTALLIRAAAATEMREQLRHWNAEPSGDNLASDGCVTSSAEVRWEPTGCDWTNPRLQPGLKKRQQEIFGAKKKVRSRGGCTEYVPLLERETEPTYNEKVEALAGPKRARHEINQSKKAAYQSSLDQS